ncbi:MAG TPA: benzoate-CoA ligase family protein [Kofleriaceae bacterium]|nr:benzoate-CoA ligase family protein [Kofleriaceae bacterium]
MAGPGDNLAARLLGDAFERGWEARVVLREGDRTWTYAQLAEQAARVATVLRTLRVSRGERVALLMRDTLDAAAALLGTIHMGAVAVPLSELARPNDLRNYLNHSQAACAIVDEELEPSLDEIRAEVPGVREILCTGARSAGERDYFAAVRAAAPAPEAATVGEDDIALLLYSAGGGPERPRGVPHRHITPFLAFESFARGVIGMTEEDRVLSVVRLSTAYGLGVGLLFPLIAGAESTLLPQQPHSSTLFWVIEKLQPTVLFATPSVYGQLARDAEAGGRNRPLARLRSCVSGAEGMPPKLVPRIRDVLGADVTVGYGLTEAFQFVLAGPADGSRPGACGRPVPGVDARVVGESGSPVGADEIGTLQLQAPTLLRSYWEEQPDQQFADGWFTTRDRFMLDANGNYFHCGRVDDLFKVSGKWVSPGEVERALLAHEAVWECAVIGADDEDGLIKPLAFVVPNIGWDAGPPLEAELREYVKSELAPYKYPRWIEFVSRLPKGPSGKILRYKLRPPGRPRRAETLTGNEGGGSSSS